MPDTRSDSEPVVPTAQGPSQQTGSLIDKADSIAQRYFSVWIWSVVVGIVTSNSVSIVNYYPQSKGPFLIILSVPVLVLSCLFTISAWYMTALFLTRYLIPAFFSGTPGDPHATRYLNLSVQFSIFGVVFRLALAVVDLLLNSAF